MDLLTTLQHELGNVLGLADEYGDEGSVMYYALAPGVRRVAAPAGPGPTGGDRHSGRPSPHTSNVARANRPAVSFRATPARSRRAAFPSRYRTAACAGAAGGGRPSRLVARPTVPSTCGAPPRSPSRSIRTALACQNGGSRHEPKVSAG